MNISIDLGGSTIDMICFNDNNKIIKTISIESESINKNNLDDIFKKGVIDLKNIKKIILTGGHNRIFPSKFNNIPIQKIAEIEAIGKGGSTLSALSDCLVISMGTGTCMVSVRNNTVKHVGGTGVGGGTLVGLGKLILKEKNAINISTLTKNGTLDNVDLSVKDIIGEGIGIIPGFATASNFGKLNNPTKSDLALGICNLIGQTIGAMANFVAQTHKHSKIILTGKLTRVKVIVDLVKQTAKLYNREIMIPKHSDFVTAIGAMHLSNPQERKIISKSEIIIYTDGGARGNPGPAGCGAVITDNTGQVLMKKMKYLGKMTNNQAEYQGLLLGLENAIKEYNPQKLVCYADSELMVKQMRGEYKIKNTELRILHGQALNFIKNTPKVEFKHIRRAKNSAADALANQAMDKLWINILRKIKFEL